ncbi:unnamed protein product [Ascophyllum nodosum]
MVESGPLLHRTAEGKGPIVENEPPLENGMMDRGRALSRAWSAAIQVCTIGAASAGAARPSRAGIIEFLLPGLNESTATSVDVGDFDKEISFDDFERSLLKGEVKRCEFFGANFEKAVLQFADGSKALIGEGYPQDRAFSDDSPLQVLAMLRNAGVPFTTPFKTNKYAKPRLYKTAETLQAENRQRAEDATLDRLMSESQGDDI